MSVRIRPESFDSAIARELNAEVQREYAVRYDGEGDVTVLTDADFTPPNGVYFVAFDDDHAVASGAWRSHGARDAEMKRLYVRPAARGRGLARMMIAALEESAAAAGRTRMILETGDGQPEALALYASLGYRPVEKFGEYACMPDAHHLGKDLAPADVMSME